MINPPALQQIWETHCQALREMAAAQPMATTPRDTHMTPFEARQETVEDLLEWFHEQAAALPSTPDQMNQGDGGLQQRSQESDDALSQPAPQRSEEHTSELQSLMRNSYAVF